MTTLTSPAPPATGRATSTPRAAVVGPLRSIGTMVRRETRRNLRSLDGLITAFVLPIAIMTVFVVIFGGAISGGDGDYINYVVPGVLVMCIGFGAATTAVSVAQDLTSGTIDRFKTLPIHASSVLWGHVLASTVRNLASVAVTIGVAYALGFRADAGLGDWFAVAGYAAVMALTFAWFSAAAGLVMSVEAAQSLNMVFLFLPYVSSGYVPIETLPTWLHGFAENQPFTPIIETLRDLLAGGATAGNLVPALAWLGGVLLVSSVGAAVAFGRRRAR
ncbi:ABC-2 type transporter [Beutenbergia cavernae DSM 12333]|uniref:Transport permease protein n=1 Tax=Beutenbergia cavernae (strain ATCC BAA-8 / DSM 12333 / CCUG 43141 / JCM 11478 / NBRC 16432 / NCIMB 13614 / HKI 0122) TaxID=471853 RepID=C5C5W4_BEUC1|nr:ABC transporter permease [Beutenbergia cavernae]ACQ82322.1 ABC-2 type transporter [Beutenbergia cavernae DSM 12333]